MGSGWPADVLAEVDTADELRIATRAADGSLRSPVPVWVVTVDGDVFVRTWTRRSTGWFGRAITVGTGRIAVADFEADVRITEVGAHDRAGVDAAYLTKYGRYGAATVDRMVSDEAAATTLRLDQDRTAG